MRIARPHGRARIETKSNETRLIRSPASPGLTAGRGLKHAKSQQSASGQQHRPASRPGAD